MVAGADPERAGAGKISDAARAANRAAIMRAMKPIWFTCLIGALGWLSAPCLAWQLQIEQLQGSGLRLQGIRIERQTDAVQVAVQALAYADLEINQRGLNWQCQWSLSVDQEPACVGKISVAEPRWQGELQWRGLLAGQTLQLRSAGASVRFAELAPGRLPEGRLSLSKVPLVWVKDQLQAAWSDLATLSGTANAELDIRALGERWQGSLALNDLGVDSMDGSVAAAAVNLAGAFEFSYRRSGRSLHWRAQAGGGEVLAGAVYFALPAADAVLDLQATAAAGKIWQWPSLSWADGDGLEVHAAAELMADGGYRVRVERLAADLGRAAPRYLKTALATAGFDGLQLQGAVDASAEIDPQGWQSLALKLQALNVRDHLGRISAENITGDLAMNASAPTNRIDFSALRLFDIPFGGGHIEWRWSPDRIELGQPLQLAVLGGSVKLPRLQRLTTAGGVASWQGGLELQGLQVKQLAAALAWPSFAGTLSGVLPQFRLENGGLKFDGDLRLKVFDGSMRISHLESERSFGIAPSLAADIDFDHLDLQQLTAAFSFGEMTGWLDGSVHDLRLLDWAPVAFDAKLKSAAGFPGKRRISQRAVQGISSVAGGAAAASNPIIKMFDSFGYSDFGLGCRLADNVCEMSGLAGADHGYTIVKGAGLPRLNVVGFQKHVDWPLLLERLHAMAAGQAPVID